MPWPPTFASDVIPFADQISEPDVEALDASTVPGIEEGVPVDLATGQLAPGVMSHNDNPFDRVEALLHEQRLFEEAERIDDDGKISSKRELVIKYAMEKLGKPYVWGGESDAEGGYDCSGLLWQAFKRAGIDMPRVSMDQARRGKRVPLTELRPGDLVAWENNARQAGADHIALYIGDGKIIEAPRPGLKVRIRKLSPRERNAWGVRLDY